MEKVNPIKVTEVEVSIRQKKTKQKQKQKPHRLLKTGLANTSTSIVDYNSWYCSSSYVYLDFDKVSLMWSYGTMSC